MQVRLAATTALLALVVAGLITLAWYIAARAQFQESVRTRLIDSAGIAALQIDPQALDSLRVRQDENSAAYQEIRTTLQHIQEASPQIGMIHTLRDESGSFVHMVSGGQETRYQARLGDPVKVTGFDFQGTYNSLSQAMAERNYITDEEGSWLPAYAPIFLPDGKRAGFLAIGISAGTIAAGQRQLGLLALAFFGVAAPFVLWGSWGVGKRLAEPVEALTLAVRHIASGDLSYRVEVKREDETGKLGQAFNTMASTLHETVTSLEKRVDDRTREIAQRSQYLETASEVGRAASLILDPDELIAKSVELIRSRFDLYYVGLFLMDEAGEWAVLRAGTGTAGQAMIARSHRIAYNQGMIGWCVANSRWRVALEAGQDAQRLASAELPDTRSEAAIPMRSRGQVIGAITVQGDQPGMFDEAMLAALQMMADQIAIALDNARLYAQSQVALEAMRNAYAEMSEKAWGERLRTRGGLAYQYDQMGLARLQTGQLPSQPKSSGPSEVSLPIEVRGRPLGVLEARKSGKLQWSKADVELVRTLIERLSLALETARLYEETQRKAERERMASEITAKVRLSNDPQAILQTVVQELRQALNANRAQVLIQPAQAELAAAPLQASDEPGSSQRSNGASYQEGA